MRASAHPLLTDKIIYANGYIWFVHYFANLLFRIDQKNNEQKVYRIPYKEHVGEKYSDIICMNGKIWLIPRMALHLVAFDLQTETFSSVEMASNVGKFERRFGGAIIHNDYLYTIPDHEKGKRVSIVDMQVTDAEMFEGLVACYTYSCIGKNMLVTVSREQDGLITVNLDNEECEVIFEDVFKKNVEYVLAECNGSLFVFGNDSLFRVSLTNKIIEYEKKTRPKSSAHLATVANKYIIVDYPAHLDYEVYSDELELVGCYTKTDKTEEKCVGSYWGEWIDIDNDSFAMLNLCKSTVGIFNKENFANPYNTIHVDIERNDIVNASLSNSIDNLSDEWYWNSLDELIHSI